LPFSPFLPFVGSLITIVSLGPQAGPAFYVVAVNGGHAVGVFLIEDEFMRLALKANNNGLLLLPWSRVEGFHFSLLYGRFPAALGW
jgi:hypothetical protein